MSSTTTTSLTEAICNLFGVWATNCFNDLPLNLYQIDTVPEEVFDIDLGVVIAPIDMVTDYQKKGIKPFSGELLKVLTIQVLLLCRNLYNTDDNIPGLYSLEDKFIRYVENQKIYFNENQSIVGWFPQAIATSLLLKGVKYDYLENKKVAYITYETLPLSFYSPTYDENLMTLNQLILTFKTLPNLNARN